MVAAHNLFYAVLMDSTDYAVAPYDAQFIVYFAYISHLFWNTFSDEGVEEEKTQNSSPKKDKLQAKRQR